MAHGDPGAGTVISVGLLGTIILFGLIAVGMWGCPTYNVWQQGLAGEAELARAEQNRKIAVQEAQAKKDAAQLLAETEVIRAQGVAQANHIIANGLGGPEGYLRYLFIQTLHDLKQGQIIYIPTEAGMPVLEATRLAPLPTMPEAK